MAASLKPSDPNSSRRPSKGTRRGPNADNLMVPIAEDDNETRTKGEELHSDREFEDEDEAF